MGISLSKVIHRFEPNIRKLLVDGFYGNENFMFATGPRFTPHLDINSIELPVSEIDFIYQ